MPEILELAADTHDLATALARPGGWLHRWREHRFTTSVAELIDALEHLQPPDIVKVTDDDRRRMMTTVDRIADDIERTVARARRHPDITRAQHLVSQIYRLRQMSELLFERVTTNPSYEDVRWELAHAVPLMSARLTRTRA